LGDRVVVRVSDWSTVVTAYPYENAEHSMKRAKRTLPYFSIFASDR